MRDEWVAYAFSVVLYPLEDVALVELLERPSVVVWWLVMVPAA